MRRGFVASVGGLLVALGATAWSRPATACQCRSPGNHVLLPSTTKYAPAVGPWLVFQGGPGAVWLEDEAGNALPTTVLRRHAALSLCELSMDLIQPATALVPGKRYTLGVEADPRSSIGPSSRTFVASDRQPRQVSRQLTVRLEHSAQGGPLGSSCVPNEVASETAIGSLGVTVTMDAPTLLFLSVSVEDSVHGTLTEGTASVGSGTSSQFALSTEAMASVFRLSTSEPCARIVVRDALDVVVLDERQCPLPGDAWESTRTVEVAEHLIREEPSPEEGCAVAGGAAPPDGGTAGRAWLGAAAVALGARLRRRRRPCSGRMTRPA